MVQGGQRTRVAEMSAMDPRKLDFIRDDMTIVPVVPNCAIKLFADDINIFT